ncbi:MAG: DNA polymerase Y family protein [bacterium]|nr:DNA polymerase Y family protein [bacterium]
MTNRIACVTIADFPLCVLLNDIAPRSLYPYAVAETDNPQALIVAVNQVASRDVQTGMTVAQARSRCAQLRMLTQDHKHEQIESDKIRELLYRVGPNVETNAPGEYYLELRGLTLLHGSEDDVCKSILRLFSPSTYAVQIGVGCNKQVARIASLLAHPYDTLNVPNCCERDFLSPLPIAALGVATETNMQLYSLGLKTIGDVAQLPLQEITRRFGDDMRCLAECLQSNRAQPILPDDFPDERFAEIRFDDPLNNLEQLEDNVVCLLRSMLEKLHTAGEGCKEISILLEGSYCDPKQINVKLSKLTCSLPAWKRQVQYTLHGMQFTIGITTIRVTLISVSSLHSSQMSLFSASQSNDDSPPSCNDELEKLSLKRISVVEKVLPEDSVMLNTMDFIESQKTKHSACTPLCYYTGRSISGLRLYRTLQVIKVTTNRENLYGIISSSGVERVIRQCSPCYVSGGWWEREFQRSYYAVETDRGMCYLLFRDEIQSKWYLQGFFD